MEEQKTKFWLTCPYCKKKFGVAPLVVLKYVDRLFSQLGRTGKHKPSKALPPENLPVAEG